MLTVMSLSAAREGALLPGRKGNRVRLGREGDAVTKAFTAPSLTFFSDPTLLCKLQARRTMVPDATPGLFHLPAFQLRAPPATS